MDGAGRGRFDEIAADRAVNQRPDRRRSMPEIWIAFSAVSTLFSLGRIPGGQNRRSAMPVMNSSRPRAIAAAGRAAPAAARSRPR